MYTVHKAQQGCSQHTHTHTLNFIIFVYHKQITINVFLCCNRARSTDVHIQKQTVTQWRRLLPLYTTPSEQHLQIWWRKTIKSISCTKVYIIIIYTYVYVCILTYIGDNIKKKDKISKEIFYTLMGCFAFLWAVLTGSSWSILFVTHFSMTKNQFRNFISILFYFM